MKIKEKVKMRVTFEPGTSWITVKGSTWIRNKYSEYCSDAFGDVWLKPFHGASNLYVTAQGPELYFTIVDGYLEEN